MLKFNNTEKRWIEIIFYLLIRKVFSINQSEKDIIKFIEGYAWTNMFDNDKLISVIANNKILFDLDFTPSKHELLITLDHPECRLRIEPRSVKELIKDTSYTYTQRKRFHAQMKEEITVTPVFPKLTIPDIHDTMYSFLLAVRYIADIVKTIKF